MVLALSTFSGVAGSVSFHHCEHIKSLENLIEIVDSGGPLCAKKTLRHRHDGSIHACGRIFELLADTPPNTSSIALGN